MLQQENFESIRGKRIGLITNHTGKDRNGKSTAEILYSAPGIKLKAILTPEHGFSGSVSHGESVESSTDPATGLPVFSLYGRINRPTPEMLRNLDALVFDIQDVGVRFYTYLSTMAYAMEEATKAGIEFIVLDRPVPITGTIVEGPVKDSAIRSFVAHYEVPIRHGMTPGEIATFYNETEGLHARLTVVRMKGWQREMWFEQTGLPWIPTSPNIPGLESAILYPGIACLEYTNLSVGRGTPIPFMWVGAPWFQPEKVLKILADAGLKGVTFLSRDFTPVRDVYANQKCRGIELKITDRDQIRPFQIFVHIAGALRDAQPEEFELRWERSRFLIGTQEFLELYNRKASPREIIRKMESSTWKFIKKRKHYLLYE
ncbi:MAG: DUF1343 domain-containing protein [Elusimicrobiota bacterium]